jgi:gluconokinase
MNTLLSPRYLFVITGPAGCGKTSIAKFLREKLGVVYIEGDDVSF